MITQLLETCDMSQEVVGGGLNFQWNLLGIPTRSVCGYLPNLGTHSPTKKFSKSVKGEEGGHKVELPF